MLENGMVLELDRYLKPLEKEPSCPLCGALCETVYIDGRDVIGCNECILDDFIAVEIGEWMAQQEEEKNERF